MHICEVGKSSNLLFFQQVKGGIQFNYPPIRYSNKVKARFVPFVQQNDQEWKFGKGDIRQLNQKERLISEKANNQSFITKEIFKTYEISSNEEYLQIKFDYFYPKDQNDQYYIVSSKARIPPIQVSVLRKVSRNAFLEQQIEQGSLFSQFFLCQQVKDQNKHYYRVIYGGLSGETKYSASNTDNLKFRGLKFQQISKKTTIFRLFISLYRENKDNNKLIKDLYMSKPLCIIQASRIIFIDDKNSLKQYFQFYGTQFMSPSRAARLSLTLQQEIMNFQRQLIKKGKKILNIILLAYKFPNSCQVYAKTKRKITQTENEKKKIQVDELDLMSYFQELIGIFLETKAKIDDYPQDQSNTRLQCNKVHPQTKIVFRIINPFEKAKILIAQQYTQFMSIVVGKKTSSLEDFFKIDSNYIKQFYSEYYKVLRTLCPKKKKKPRARFFLNPRQRNDSQQQQSQFEQASDNQQNRPDAQQENPIQENKQPLNQQRHKISQNKVILQKTIEKNNNYQGVVLKKKRGRKTNAQRQAIKEAMLFAQKAGLNETQKRRTREAVKSKRQNLQIKVDAKKQGLNTEKKQINSQVKKQETNQAVKLNLFPHEKSKNQKGDVVQLSDRQKDFKTPRKERQNQQTNYKTYEQDGELNIVNKDNRKSLGRVKQEEDQNPSIHQNQHYHPYFSRFMNEASVYPIYRPQFPYYGPMPPNYIHKNQQNRYYQYLRPNQIQHIRHAHYNPNSIRYERQRQQKIYYPPQRNQFRELHRKSHEAYPFQLERSRKSQGYSNFDSQSDYHKDFRTNKFQGNSWRKRHPYSKVLSESDSDNDSRYLKKIEPRRADYDRYRRYQSQDERDFDPRRYESQFRHKK